MKKQRISGHDMDRALARAGSTAPQKGKKLRTEAPVAEKDEEKQAEERQRERMKGENS